MFGQGLGTGDYGHMVIEHSPMLIRKFKSMGKYSNEGFEAAHKLHRQLYAQCTNHDSSFSESSIQGNVISLDDSGDPQGVDITSIGKFNSSGVKALEAYCKVKDMQRDYRDEMSWLTPHKGSPSQVFDKKDIEKLCHIFKCSPLEPMRTIASLDGINIDFKSLSTLIGERCIDNFVINYSLRKTWTLESSLRQTKVVYLPNEVIYWLQCKAVQSIEDILRRDVQDPKCLENVVIPLYMRPSHWGILCLDFENSVVWFDEGMSKLK
ncbi:hypothetical protein QZH41_020537 [Actinostola sp. cb2023]|nr:hypothetical protein QZH41_020537 [Actinostola sp. cb2023]